MRMTTGVEKTCVGHFKLLFSLLKQKSNAHMQLMALQVISKVTANRACVKDIAASNVLVFLLFTLVTLPKGKRPLPWPIGGDETVIEGAEAVPGEERGREDHDQISLRFFDNGVVCC